MLIYWTIKDLVEVIEGCVQNKFDVVICAEGRRGCGKSTLLYKIASRLGRRGIVHFTPDSSLVYSREETLKLIANKKKWVIFSDEMINVSYKRDFYQEDQKQVIKALNMYRDSCNVFMMAVPLFKDLDGDIRQLTKIKLSVIRRGIAEIRIQPSFHDVLDSQAEANRKKAKYKNKDLKLEPTRKVGLILFKDLSDKQKEVYGKIKSFKRGQVFGEGQVYIDPMENWYNRLFEQITTKKLTASSLSAIIDMAGKNETTVRGRLGQMLRDKRMPTMKELLISEKVEKKLPEYD